MHESQVLVTAAPFRTSRFLVYNLHSASDDGCVVLGAISGLVVKLNSTFDVMGAQSLGSSSSHVDLHSFVPNGSPRRLAPSGRVSRRT